MVLPRVKNMITQKIYHNPAKVTVSFLFVTIVLAFANWYLNSIFLQNVFIIYLLVFIVITIMHYQALANKKNLALNAPEKLLIIAPHQDDCVLMASGLAIKNLALGGDVRIIYLTQEEDAHKAEIRKQECFSAWRLAGVSSSSLTQLNLLPKLYEEPNPDKIEYTRDTIQQYVNEYLPTLVVFPAFEGGHRHHDLTNYIASFLIKYPKRTLLYESPIYSIYYSFLHTPHKIIKLLTRFASFNMLAYYPPVESPDKRKISVLQMSENELLIKKKMLESFVSQNGSILRVNHGYRDRLIQWIPNRYRPGAFNFKYNFANIVRLMYKYLPTRIAVKIYPTDIRSHGYQEGITDLDYELGLKKSLAKL